MPFKAVGRDWSSQPAGSQLRAHVRVRLLALFTLLLIALVPARAAAADSWFKTDTHVHSVVSGDGLPDLGIIGQAGKSHGYNAMFVTDHQAGSNFPISTVIANHVAFDDDLGSKWLVDSFGTPSTKVAELAPTPVRSGSQSLHVKATAAASGESFVRLKRGPNLRSGDLILRFSAFPTRVDAGSGLYVSASLGGDVSEGTLQGYTTQDGTIAPGKSTVLVWQLGNARTPSSDPNQRVITNGLPYTLNQWNDYEINMTTGAVKLNGSTVTTGGGGLQSIPAADRPLDYNALQVMKMSASASGGGTAEGYFDQYNLDASVPVQGGDEFAFRNTALGTYNTSSFRLYPSIEMGFNRHAQRFNFDISGASAYNSFFQCDAFGEHCRITRGIDGILPTQQTGYLAQLNHPNLPGGVKADEMAADDYRAFGADVMEVREDAGAVPPSTMIDLWDEVLKRGRVLIGTWSSDMHKTDSLDVDYRGVATYIRAPSLGFDDLMRSLYEGRAYLARNTFDGRVVFNLDAASQEPYPARYPVYVPATQSSASVHMAITGSIPSGSRVVWISNGATIATDTPGGASYEATKSIPLGGAFTYVRAELRNSAGERIAMTEPIFFDDVAGLPASMRFGVDGVTTGSGRDYTRIATQGITAATWNDGGQSLDLGLGDPSGSLTRLSMSTGGLVPIGLRVDGAAVPQSSSQAAFDSATGSAWRFDSATGRLQFKVLQASSAADVTVQFPAAPDTERPTAPATLTATASGPAQIDLDWAASSDDRGVTGYRVRRGTCGAGSVIATVGHSTTAYSDTSLSPGTTASYQVEAFDAAGNTSLLSPCATATTPRTATTTFTPVADAYVAADTPTTNFGIGTKLRADASPDTRSYLRFDLSGLQGTVVKATLVTTATSASSAGYSVGRVADTTWGERQVDYSTAPPVASGPPLGSTLGFAAGGSPSVDVTAAVAGNGPVGFALTTSSSTALTVASREAGATGPRLVVETAPGPAAPASLTATAAGPTRIDLAWTASSGPGVAGYRVRRGACGAGSVIATVGAGATTYSDTTLTAGTTASYQVEAFDSAGNTSPLSQCATATTPGSGGTTTTTFTPVADSYVAADTPATNFGAGTKLRADASPDTRSYLRFDVSGLQGSVVKATLVTTATSASSAGYAVRAVADTTWGERQVNYSNAPPVAAGSPLGSTPAFAIGATPSVDVTSAVAGNGPVGFALTTASSTALSVASREAGATSPQLVVQATGP